MKQILFEQNGGTYTKQGDYYIPDIKLLEQPEYEIGIWAIAAGSILSITTGPSITIYPVYPISLSYRCRTAGTAYV